ncbi:hypothetical protein ZU49_004069 [Salmonella enterica subsp. enterica]|nr:hypothetical protein [Salmonella enterica subsp. enterica]
MEQTIDKRIVKYNRIMQPVKLSAMLSNLNIIRGSYYASTLFFLKKGK